MSRVRTKDGVTFAELGPGDELTDLPSQNGQGATGAKVPNPHAKSGTRPDTGPFRLLSMKRMTSEPPPKTDWVVPSIAAREHVTELWGAKGLGKSLLCEEITRAVATGGTVAGLQCARGRVLYIDAENGEYEIWRRVAYLGLPQKNVRMVDAGGANLIGHEDYFAALVKYVKPDLLILDSRRRLTLGMDENDSNMAEVIAGVQRLAQALKFAAVFIHHPRKDGTSARGTGAVGDQVSIEWKNGAVQERPLPAQAHL